MSDYDQNAAISFDGEIIYNESERDTKIEPGEYLFKILQYKRENVQATGKMPNHVNVKFQLELENADGIAGRVWDNMRMYMKWAWKLARIAKSIGHTAVDSNQIRIDWSRFEGAEGRLKLTHKTWKKQDGTETLQNEYEYLPPADTTDEVNF